MPRIDGTEGDDVLHGTAQPDTIYGYGGADTLYGEAGDDWLVGGAAADVLDGGAGKDGVRYFGSSAGVSVNLATGFGSGGDAQGDVLVGVENVTGSAHADILIGSRGDNILRGGAGADVIDGLTGTDLVTYFDSTSGVTVDLAAGTGSGGTATGDLLIAIEQVNGSAYADILIGGASDYEVLRGGAGDDTLRGGGGIDTLRGGVGADILRGGAGHDTLVGGAGADMLDGGTDNDLVTYFDSTTGVTVNLAAGTGSGGTATGDTLISIEVVVGSAYGDTLIGSDGNDSFLAGSGDDILRGGAGADGLYGGDGFDLVTYFDSTEGVTVTLGLFSGTGSGGTAEGDTLSSIEAVNGSAHADTLIGDGDANTLSGAGGRDVLTGGDGADRFVFAAVSHSATGAANADRITDFRHAQGDRIDLSQIDANGGAAGNGAFIFIGTGAYTGVAGQLRYALSGSDAVIGGDVDGDGVSDFNIALSNVGSLQAADFVL